MSNWGNCRVFVIGVLGCLFLLPPLAKAGNPIVAHSNRSGNYDIWSMDEAGGNLVQLTSFWGDDMFPRWSPDGSKIAYYRAPGDWGSLVQTNSCEVRVMNADGSDDHFVTPIHCYYLGVPGWTPDSKNILYTKGSGCGASVYKVDIDATGDSLFLNPGIVGDAQVYELDFTMDGSTIVWSSQNGCWAPTAEIFIASVSEGEVVASTAVPLTSNGTLDYQVAFSPAGDKIAFTRSDSSTGWTAPRNVYVMNSDGSNVSPLTHVTGNGMMTDPKWSPDGSAIVYVASPGQLRIVNADGSNDMALTTDAFTYGKPDWNIFYSLPQDISADPINYDFGFVELGVSRTTAITVSNDGDEVLTIYAIYLETDSNAEFSFSLPPTVPLEIMAGQSLEIFADYTPSTLYNWASGFHVSTGEIVIVSDDPDEAEVRVGVSGKGSVDLNVDQDALNFVNVAGNLWDAGKIELTTNGSSGGNKFSSLMDMVLTAGGHVSEGDTVAACESLWGAYKHTDGNDRPKDFISGEGAAILASQIESMMNEHGCEQAP